MTAPLVQQSRVGVLQLVQLLLELALHAGAYLAIEVQLGQEVILAPGVVQLVQVGVLQLVPLLLELALHAGASLVQQGQPAQAATMEQAVKQVQTQHTALLLLVAVALVAAVVPAAGGAYYPNLDAPVTPACASQTPAASFFPQGSHAGRGCATLRERNPPQWQVETPCLLVNKGFILWMRLQACRTQSGGTRESVRSCSCCA